MFANNDVAQEGTMKMNRRQLFATLSMAGVMVFPLCGSALADGAREVSLSSGTNAKTVAFTNAAFVNNADFNHRVLSDGLLTTYLPASDVTSNQRILSDALVATLGRDAGLTGASPSSDIRFESGFDSGNAPDFRRLRHGHGPWQPPHNPWCDVGPSPEPASMLLFGTGLLAIGAFVRRSRRSRTERA
jgi:hypothetical protein